jgi:hypothetical protein
LSLKPPTAAAAGTPPSGEVTQNVKIKVTKSSREFGIKPRGVALSRTLGTAPDTFTKQAFLPVLTPAAFATPAFAIGSSITIGGVVWTVVGRRAEDFN